MTISFILNGEDVVTNVDANTRLLNILRDKFKLSGTKDGCLNGYCGSCIVFFNGKIVSSCLIPAFRVRGSEVITLEGYLQQDEYKDVVQGFSVSNVYVCEYCQSGKMLIAETLLQKKVLPSRQEIIAAFDGIKCRCTEPERLADGIQAAAEIRRRRIYGR
jgi:carbon-monoxide dehydrogenase small subunit